MRRRMAAALVLAASNLMACSHTTIYSDHLQDIAEQRKDSIRSHTESSFLFGLVPPAAEIAKVDCGSLQVTRVETRRSFLNGLISFATVGMYTPVTISVACRREALTKCPTSGRAGAVPTVAPPVWTSHRASEDDFTGASLYLDQDSFLKYTTDEFYTMGGMFTRSGSWVVREHLDRPLRFFDYVFHVRDLRHNFARKNSGDSLYESHTIQGGVSAFTLQKGSHKRLSDGKRVFGDSLGDTLPHFMDRPYACLSYLESRQTTARGKNAITSTLSVGLLGTGVCRVIQTFIHQNLTHDTTPGGWKNQISNSGEPTIKYRVSYTRLIVAFGGNERRSTMSYNPEATHWLDWTGDGEVNAGYYTNAAVGSRLRFGLINSAYWGGERRPIGPVSVDVTSRSLTATTRSSPGITKLFGIEELYVWGSGGVTEWGYNALMQGQFAHSVVRLSFDPANTSVATLRRSVRDLEWGINLRVHRIGVMYQYNHQSEEFAGPDRNAHAWGGIYVSFSPPD